MATFSKRPLTYQMGIVLLLLATSAYTAGLALPWWAQTDSETSHSSHSGLWFGCSTGSTQTCTRIHAPVWLKAVQVVQIMGLVAMLAACAHAIFINCCLDYARHSRAIEFLAGTGGLLGLVSAVLYVSNTLAIVRKSHSTNYSWAFSLDVAGCILVLFIAAIIAVANEQHTDNHVEIIVDNEISEPEQRPRSRPCETGRDSSPRLDACPTRAKRLGGTSSSCRREALSLRNECPSPQPLSTVLDTENCGVSIVPVVSQSLGASDVGENREVRDSFEETNRAVQTSQCPL